MRGGGGNYNVCVGGGGIGIFTSLDLVHIEKQ